MRNSPQCNTDSSSHRILRRRTWHFHHNLVFHCNKEQHSTAVHVVFATDWRSNSVSESKRRDTQGLFNKSCWCRGWVHRVGYHSSWLSVTWWSFTFPHLKTQHSAHFWVKWGFHQTCFVKRSPDGLVLCLPDLYCSLLVTQGSGSQSGGHGLLGAIKNWREDNNKKTKEKINK